MMKHTLTFEDVHTLQPGRILNSLIAEYVLNDCPSRWNEEDNTQIPCSWFDPHPQHFVDDDVDCCCADTLPDFSGDITRAMSLSNAPVLVGKCLSTKTADGIVYARFGTDMYDNALIGWAHAETMPLAICRAALLTA